MPSQIYSPYCWQILLQPGDSVVRLSTVESLQFTDTCALDTGISNETVSLFESELTDRIVGQPEAVASLVRAYKVFLVGMNPPGRPIAVLLFAGSTGVGKSNSVRAMADVLFANRNAYTKIDCSEFHSSHEVSKLLGSPAGYLGHKETEPLLSQQRIDRFQTQKAQLNLILFDEIEKAHGAFWELLLGIFDTGQLTLGTNITTDFSKSVIIMTTNLGVKEMERIMQGKHIGFQQPDKTQAIAAVDNTIRGTFTPEFMNRIDSTVIFNNLERSHLESIFKLEMRCVQDRILNARCPIFVLTYTPDARDFLISIGTDTRYGARELKRVIEKHVVSPLTDLLLSKQIHSSDTVTVDLDNNGDIVFLESHAQ